MGRLLVLKLGGSLITNKREPYSVRTDTIKAVSREIKEIIDSKLIDDLVIIHGVGSYGHPPVIEHKLHKGFIDPKQLVPLSWTQGKVNELRMLLASNLTDVGIPINFFHTSSIATANKGKITCMDLDAVKGYLKIGMVPMLGGDVVYDTAMGFSVGSGDQVATIIAKELGATDLVFATDVAGVYDKDPKSNPDARIVHTLSLSKLKDVSSSQNPADASGAMYGKVANLESIRPEMQRGLRTNIISMMQPGLLKGLLKGEDRTGTSICP